MKKILLLLDVLHSPLPVLSSVINVVEVLPGKPSEVLPAFVAHHGGTPLVVMGAYGRTAVSRFFRQSLADAVMEKTDASLFTTHE